MRRESFLHKFTYIQQYLKQYQVDGLILTTPISARWLLSAFDAVDFCLIVVDKKTAHCFLDARDINGIRGSENIPHLKIVKFTGIDKYIAYVKKLKLEKILVDETNETIGNLNKYIKPIGFKKIIEFNGNVLRMIKADEEIKAMQKSADVLCAAMNHIRKTIKIGETETGVASRLIKHMFANGATGLSFPPIVAFGENAANIHHISSDRKLRKNDNILVDAGCVYDKYCSDITRCWYVGEVSNEVKKAYDVVLRANLVGIANAKISMKGKELDTIVRNVVTLGLGCDYEHGTGHGIGLIVHENPYVNKIYDGRLLENSVFTIEPGIYFEKKFGFRVEDTIVLTKKGPKILTSKCSKTFTNHF